jgi:hypothetical protein
MDEVEIRMAEEKDRGKQQNRVKKRSRKQDSQSSRVEYHRKTRLPN